ncbi:hypothetical protein L3X38_023617 [Prunus dulcis]|uniref:Uncharacterized protein n=1 Tax=Prunus dulcis TaxID=3755 RepID=A0AAD4Z5H5_PRUDU|nr:hypothetical protein L3X38_023617 [Prunus dulcis]
MVGSKRTRSKTAAMAQSVTAQSYSSHDPTINMAAPPPLAAMNPQRPPRVTGTTVPSAVRTTAPVTPRTGSTVAGYCPLWAWLHSHQPARFCFWELTKQLPRVVTHPGIAPASNSLNFGVPTNPKPVSSQEASSKSEWRSGLAQLHLARYCPLWARPTPPPHGFVPGSSQSNFPGWSPILGLL